MTDVVTINISFKIMILSMIKAQLIINPTSGGEKAWTQ